MKTAPRPVIDLDKLGQPADELEAEAFAEGRMILAGVNLLVHAHNADSVLREEARPWWDACLADTEGVGLAWAMILGFVRITANRRAVVHSVMEQLQGWLGQY